MLENLFCAFVAVFFSVGVVCAAYALMLRLTRPRGERAAVVVFLRPGAPEGALILSRRLAARRLMGGGSVIAVCAAGDEAAARRLRRTFPREPGLSVCTRGELEETLAEFSR